jgi:single-strand DNA-binding protein
MFGINPRNHFHGTPAQMNRVHLIGRLTADPELRVTTKGNVVHFRMATNDHQPAQFHTLVAWNENANVINREAKKGQLMFVDGWLGRQTWKAADGTMRSRVDVIVQEFELLR